MAQIDKMCAVSERQMTRLDTIAPSLVAGLSRADDRRRRAATLDACERAIREVGVNLPEVDDALTELSAQRPIPSGLKTELEMLVIRLDDEYFKLSNENEQLSEEAMVYFARARAISALVFATDPDPFRAACEGIYEAAAAVELKESFIAAVMKNL